MGGRLVVTMMVAFVENGLGRRNAADPYNTEDQQNRDDDLETTHHHAHCYRQDRTIL